MRTQWMTRTEEIKAWEGPSERRRQVPLKPKSEMPNLGIGTPSKWDVLTKHITHRTVATLDLLSFAVRVWIWILLKNLLNFLLDWLIPKLVLCRLHGGLKRIFYLRRIKSYHLRLTIRKKEVNMKVDTGHKPSGKFKLPRVNNSAILKRSE